MPPHYIRHVRAPQDLVTSLEAIREGFISQARAKILKAKPFVDEALEFERALKDAKHLTEVLAMEAHWGRLSAAAGFSEKALNNVSPETAQVVLRAALDEIFRESGEQWRDAILSRYLLTKGDSLGGTMRNVTGALAQRRFADSVVRALGGIAGVSIRRSAETEKIQEVEWRDRILLFDKRSPLIDKSVDVILLNRPGEERWQTLIRKAGSYVACGELKGGIDPAGADEHWKTARTSLERIRERLTRPRPALFFVGAAIEANMANEIFNDLEEGRLQHAANLNYENQLDDLVRWLVSL
ncbi:MAG: AvaI/BsoBI family type II restriction endonuclease [Candidatus Binatia bacterium]